MARRGKRHSFITIYGHITLDSTPAGTEGGTARGGLAGRSVGPATSTNRADASLSCRGGGGCRVVGGGQAAARPPGAEGVRGLAIIITIYGHISLDSTPRDRGSPRPRYYYYHIWTYKPRFYSQGQRESSVEASLVTNGGQIPLQRALARAERDHRNHASAHTAALLAKAREGLEAREGADKETAAVHLDLDFEREQLQLELVACKELLKTALERERAAKDLARAEARRGPSEAHTAAEALQTQLHSELEAANRLNTRLQSELLDRRGGDPPEVPDATAAGGDPRLAGLEAKLQHALQGQRDSEASLAKVSLLLYYHIWTYNPRFYSLSGQGEPAAPVRAGCRPNVASPSS